MNSLVDRVIRVLTSWKRVGHDDHNNNNNNNNSSTDESDFYSQQLVYRLHSNSTSQVVGGGRVGQQQQHTEAVATATAASSLLLCSALYSSLNRVASTAAPNIDELIDLTQFPDSSSSVVTTRSSKYSEIVHLLHLLLIFFSLSNTSRFAFKMKFQGLIEIRKSFNQERFQE